MEKSRIAVLFTMMALGACSPAANANVAVETRSLPKFSTITLNGISTVRVHQGPQAIRITIDADVIDRYETRVQGDNLLLGFKCSISNLWALKNLKTCEVDITLPELKGVILNGAGNMVVDEFDYKKLELQLNGASIVELRGRADEFKVSCTGACKVLARNLAANSSRIGLTGASRVEVSVNNSLDASITGAGNLKYWGKPKVSQRITGAGSLQQGDD